mmetsp:Transcript_23852/g.37863  ORF Transcript_23852/g.37863 Transcript_23852/m.37863 type:complete len:101 (+) Transcript_23852:57-359(+)
MKWKNCDTLKVRRISQKSALLRLPTKKRFFCIFKICAKLMQWKLMLNRGCFVFWITSHSLKLQRRTSLNVLPSNYCITYCRQARANRMNCNLDLVSSMKL